jgi:hypothetical protein
MSAQIEPHSSKLTRTAYFVQDAMRREMKDSPTRYKRYIRNEIDAYITTELARVLTEVEQRLATAEKMLPEDDTHRLYVETYVRPTIRERVRDE